MLTLVKGAGCIMFKNPVFQSLPIIRYWWEGQGGGYCGGQFPPRACTCTTGWGFSCTTGTLLARSRRVNNISFINFIFSIILRHCINVGGDKSPNSGEALTDQSQVNTGRPGEEDAVTILSHIAELPGGLSVTLAVFTTECNQYPTEQTKSKVVSCIDPM